MQYSYPLSNFITYLPAIPSIAGAVLHFCITVLPPALFYWARLAPRGIPEKKTWNMNSPFLNVWLNPSLT